jgi:adenylate cyclase
VAGRVASKRPVRRASAEKPRNAAKSRISQRELLRSYRSQRSLLEMIAALGGRLDLAAVIEKILETLTARLDADRASLFLVDRARGELWSKVAHGLDTLELRFPITSGIAGHVATTGKLVNTPDAYKHPAFNREIDRKTGYRTRSVLCGPIRDEHGEVIGVVTAMNRRGGPFTESDVDTLNGLGGLLAMTLRNAILYEAVVEGRREVSTLLDVANALARTLDLTQLIEIILTKAREIMDAERSTLFLVDRERGELWSKVAEGLGSGEIRLPLGTGIAGHVAATGATVNVADAYDHPLFSRVVDQRTGFRTRALLCMPIRDSAGTVVGVTQVVNKRVGAFSAADERLLAAFSSQAGVAVEKATLFERVREMKAYLESVIESLSNGVVSIDTEGRITTANAPAARLLGVAEAALPGASAAQVLGAVNAELPGRVARVHESGQAFLQYDLDGRTPGGRAFSTNVNAVPLLDPAGARRGVVVVLDDITSEKRVKSSLSRYMSKDVVEKLLADEDNPALGGVRQDVTILFSDIRSYTSLTENAGAHEIVEMLNEYFSRMVDVIFERNGILDKFIGDAIMAVFGVPFARPEADPVNAVEAALDMQAHLAAYNKERVARGQSPIKTGIGLASGEVVCGNIGSEKRMDYTVIGDAVNLASRLEGATKQYGVHILIGEHLRARIGARFACREIDRLRVKGKRAQVRVHEVLGRSGSELPAETARRIERHQKAYALYQERAFQDAAAAFSAAAKDFPEDAVFRLYAERAQDLAAHPPAADWDGVWDLQQK